MTPTCRHAAAIDAKAIADLVNQAYRPANEIPGWTHEAHLIAGPRTSPDQVQHLFRPDSAVLVLCLGIEIVACVHVQQNTDSAQIGMLAVAPASQAQGFGKQMLGQAEKYAETFFSATVFRMSVISNRPELIAFYERRGYRRTGQSAAYPLSAGAGIPVVHDVRIEILEKPAA